MVSYVINTLRSVFSISKIIFLIIFLVLSDLNNKKNLQILSLACLFREFAVISDRF